MQCVIPKVIYSVGLAQKSNKRTKERFYPLFQAALIYWWSVWMNALTIWADRIQCFSSLCLQMGAIHSCYRFPEIRCCLLYTSDAADDLLCVDLGGRRII